MAKRAQKKEHQELSALLWGMLGAWLKPYAERLLVRIPVRWRIVGGFLLAGVLLFIARMPELAYPVAAATAGLVAVTILQRRRASLRGLGQVAHDWDAIVADNEKLTRVLKGSKFRVLEQDATGFSVGIELAGGHTPAEVEALAPNLESVFRTAPGELRVYGDPTARWRVLMRAGEGRPALWGPTAGRREAPAEGSAPAPEGQAAAVQAWAPSWHERLFSGLQGARAGAGARGKARRRVVNRAKHAAGRAEELAELKRQAELRRQRGKR